MRGPWGRAGAELMTATPALLAEALDAAGGEERWGAAERISAHVRSGGLLPAPELPATALPTTP